MTTGPGTLDWSTATAGLVADPVAARLLVGAAVLARGVASSDVLKTGAV